MWPFYPKNYVVVPDEWLLSPKRLYYACLMYKFWQKERPDLHIGLFFLLRYHRRPQAAHDAGVY